MTRLARIGYENIKGYLNGGIDAWKDANGETDCIKTISITELNDTTDKSLYRLLDVRNQTEFKKEHLCESIHIPLEEINSRMQELKNNQQYAVYCAGGYRSMIAASILKKNGFQHILNIEGGVNEVKITAPQLVEYL